MTPANLGAVRLPFVAAAVLAFLAVPASSQVVEKGRTLAELIAVHPCDAETENRIARVTDCDAADDVGDGGGAFQCWVSCDGSAPWVTQAIGAGGGGLPGADEVTESMLKSVNACVDEYVLTCETTTGDFEWQVAATGDVVGPASALDNEVARYDTTTGKLLQSGSLIKILDGTGGTNANIINVSGTLTLRNDAADPGNISVGSQSWIIPGGDRVGVVAAGRFSIASDQRFAFSSSTTEAYNMDTALVRSAAGIVGFTDATTGGGAIHLTPMASPPRTCDATAEGDIYSDTSHALCWCSGSAWTVVIGAGSCA